MDNFENVGTTPSGAVVSPAEIRHHRLLHKREAAAHWIHATLGDQVPTETDDAFRAALDDGTILCRLLNALQPGTIPHIVDNDCVASLTEELRSRLENVSLFLEQAPRFTAEIFSASDLKEQGERPQVAECILSLQDWQHHAAASHHTASFDASHPSAMLQPQRNREFTPSPLDAAAAAPSSRVTMSMGNNPPPISTFTPEAINLVDRHGMNDGFNYLMQSCTHMLKTRMGIPATPLPDNLNGMTTNSDIALDALGPVLETVLANLTSEYERRLLAKDKEHQLQADAVEGLRRQVAALRDEAEHWRHQAEQSAAAQSLESEALKLQERAEYERLRSVEASLLCELASKRRELETVEAESKLAATRYEKERTALCEELDRLREMQSKYGTLVKENRQLYNLVQDLRGSIRVYCRIRPLGATGDETACRGVESGADGAVAVYSQKHDKWHEFCFDRVFDEASSQDEVYAETKPLVRSVLDGYNVCIFAYGQTGSGKTHTMAGPAQDPGIYTRALEDLFSQRQERADEATFHIRVQLLEVYNETVRDLLVSEAEARTPRTLSIVATKASGLNVPDAIQVEVHSPDEVAAVLQRGARNRAVAETRLNERSSRSHQILTILVEGVSRDGCTRTTGCLHLIDLAGSERVGRSGAEGQQLLEAQHINRSLTALGCVMQALAQKRDHVPYRDSKLTQLLQDSLAGSSKTMMFMHIAPESSSASETLSTLHFGQGVTEITLGAAKRNVDKTGASWEARERLAAAKSEAAVERRRREALEKEVVALKAKLAKLEHVSTCSPRNLSPSPAQEPTSSSGTSSIRAYRPDDELRRQQQATSAPSRSIASNGLARPPQVSRLNLSKLSLGSNGASGENSGTPPQQQQQPLSARDSRRTSNLPASLMRSGSLTARPSLMASPAERKPSPLAGSLTQRGERRSSSLHAPGQDKKLKPQSGIPRTARGSFGRGDRGGESGTLPTPRLVQANGHAPAPSQPRRWM